MARIDNTYHKLLIALKEHGIMYEDPKRMEVFRKQVPYADFFHSMAQGFPAITTKKLYWRGVVGELIWFLRGDTNIKYLIDNGINIWNKDAYSYYLKQYPNIHLEYDDWLEEIGNVQTIGDLDRVYGAQWRNWGDEPQWDPEYETWDTYGGLDQMEHLIDGLKKSPYSTDHIVTAWNPAELNEMALPPCHFNFQIMCYPIAPTKCECSESESIYCGSKCQKTIGFDLIWDQRSVDTFLGLPFNIASYALLMIILGEITGYHPMNLRGSLRNVHLYDNSFASVDEQLGRDVNKYSSPIVTISKNFKKLIQQYNEKEINLTTLFGSIEIADIIIENYASYPGIKVKMLERTKN